LEFYNNLRKVFYLDHDNHLFLIANSFLEKLQMIYLNAEVVSGLGEDTFWTWFKREFPSSSFEIPKKLNDEDILLRYSTLGFHPVIGKQVALCWELYPEMKRVFHSDQWDNVLSKVYQTARYSTYRTVATQFSIKYYQEFGTVDVIPIGVDTNLFKPFYEKGSLRNKYGLPLDKTIGIWVGTMHPMKGFSELLNYASLHPEIYWIVVWKWEPEAGSLQGASNFVQVPQETLAELMGAADFYLFTSKLEPFYMTEWEAMSCNKPITMACEMKREFSIGENPRDEVFRLGWDRNAVKTTWEKFLIERGIGW
jgi:glycosyltransferase involved in cell wall biosynthesis